MKPVKLTQIKRVSVWQTLHRRTQSISPRRRIIYIAGIPLTLLTLWSLVSAMSAPKIEAPIARNVEPLRATYSDPLYSLTQAVGIDARTNRGNLDASTNQLALDHLSKHAQLSQDLLSAYKRDLMIAAEVPKLQELARKEIEAGGELPTDKIGDINFQTCVESGITQTDCIFLRYAGDGLARMAEGHKNQDYAQFIDGERVYLTAIAALGDTSARSPDFETTKLTLKTYRAAARDALSLNKMWLGDGEAMQTTPAISAEGIEQRIENTLGD